MAWRAKTRKTLLALGFVILVGGVCAFIWRDWIERQFFEPTKTTLEQGITEAPAKDIEIVAEDLSIPWGIAFLPEGDMLVTERTGTLKRLGADGQAFVIEGVRHEGEGGLLGIALHPDFEHNRYLYLYLTTEAENRLINRVERYTYHGGRLIDKQLILDNIPGSAVHDGGQLAFGPDGKLYITTGDAGEENSAQDLESLAGKILRLDANGRVPADNPFDNAVYSYGHRNVQGIAWDEAGRLWATEHGPSGAASGNDELNLIEKGRNYGWPKIVGSQRSPGLVEPKVESTADETWAPGALAFKDGSLFFTGLRGETLYEANVANGNIVNLTGHLRSKYGRLRAATFGPDGFLYVSTSNTDGRGEPKPGDDKIIKINTRIF